MRRYDYFGWPRRFLLLVTACSPGALVSGAAQPAVESFDSGANGWTGSSELLAVSWSFTGGVVRAGFPNAGPFPDIATLSNTPAATSGSFTGDYDQAGIEVIGFSFYAPVLVPSDGGRVELQWGGSTSRFWKVFTVAETGRWYRFTASLGEEDKASWNVAFGDLSDFSAARQSVSHLAIRFGSTLTFEHDFLVDDIFAAGSPDGAAIDGTEGLIVWQGLLSGVGYEVERTTNLLDGSWSFYEQIQATGALHHTVITNIAEPFGIFRMYFK